jgi:hypothetical protein
MVIFPLPITLAISLTQDYHSATQRRLENSQQKASGKRLKDIDKKITAGAAIFFLRKEMLNRLSGLYQSADAFGAQNLADFAPILVNTDGLQIRAEGSRSRFFRPRTVATEGRFLSTICTGSHYSFSFPAYGYKICEDNF